MPLNNVALRHGEPFDVRSVDHSLILVSDTKGNVQPGKVILSDDNRTMLFLPERPYPAGAEIHVEVKSGLLTQSGKRIEPIEFSFFVTSKIIADDKDLMEAYFKEERPVLFKPQNKTVISKSSVKSNDLPEGYAQNEVLINNNPPAGHYFFAPYNEWNLFPETLPFITITDVYGTPVYYRKLETGGYDLKKHSNGYLSFYSFHPFWSHQVMDSSYRIIDSFKMGNGYTYTDFHDFQLLDNGHAFVMTYDPQIVDMSLIVPGGNPEATVKGFVMQEIDSEDNVVFQWRSWDHFEITETGPEIDLTSDQIDYVHGNTIEVESDTSLLISSRNMHEITKIHRNTGDIIWRFGGSQNQFELIGDTIWFSRQHDSRRIYNGHVTAFDNGTTRPGTHFSSAVEYDLDLSNYTATLVNRYRHEPDYFGGVMGNSCWTPQETIVIGWGSTVPGITEIDYSGNVIYELHFDGISYRSYRFPWKTNYFTFNTDTLKYGYIWQEDSLSKSFKVYNPQAEDLELTGYHTMTEAFVVENNFPVVIPSGSHADFVVKFKPAVAGSFEDILTLNSDTNTDTLVQRIAQQINLKGNATPGQGLSNQSAVQITASPNPVTNILKLSFGDIQEELNITIYSSTGQKILETFTSEDSFHFIDMSSFQDGLYVIEIRNSMQEYLSRLKIVKE